MEDFLLARLYLILFIIIIGLMIYLPISVRNKSDTQDLINDRTVLDSMSVKDKRDPKKVLEGGDELD